MNEKDALKFCNAVTESILATTPYKAENFFIAGGCIRDTLLGRCIKDIDVVVDDGLPMNFGEWEWFEEGDTHYNRGVLGLFRTEHTILGYPVEFMRRKHAFSTGAIFDYHITPLSNVAYNPVRRELIIDPLFEKAVAEQVIPVTLKESEMEVPDVKYIERLQQKYAWPVRYAA